MSNNDKNKPDKIVFTAETSLKYWCELLNCEKEDLLYSISVIGNSFKAVDSFLTLNRKKKS